MDIGTCVKYRLSLHQDSSLILGKVALAPLDDQITEKEGKKIHNKHSINTRKCGIPKIVLMDDAVCWITLLFFQRRKYNYRKINHLRDISHMKGL